MRQEKQQGSGGQRHRQRHHGQRHHGGRPSSGTAVQQAGTNTRARDGPAGATGKGQRQGLKARAALWQGQGGPARSERKKARPRARVAHSMISYILHSRSQSPTVQGRYRVIWRALPSSRKQFSPPSGRVAQKSPPSDKGFRGSLYPRRLPGEVLLQTEPSPSLHTSHGCLLCTCARAVAAKACADFLVLFHLNNRFLNNRSEKNPMLRHFHFNINESLTCKL